MEYRTLSQGGPKAEAQKFLALQVLRFSFAQSYVSNRLQSGQAGNSSSDDRRFIDIIDALDVQSAFFGHICQSP